MSVGRATDLLRADARRPLRQGRVHADATQNSTSPALPSSTMQAGPITESPPTCFARRCWPRNPGKPIVRDGPRRINPYEPRACSFAEAAAGSGICTEASSALISRASSRQAPRDEDGRTAAMGR